MGDPACHLSSTCLSCGRFLDDERAEADNCPHCGEDLSVLRSPLLHSGP